MIKGSRKYFALAALLAVLAMMVPARTTSAGKPPCIPAWNNGNIVHFTVTNRIAEENGKQGKREGVAIPFYAFGPPMMAPQFEVLSKIPGQSGYRPWWEVMIVVVLDGRNVTTNPFKSEQEILDAQTAGKVLIIDTEFAFLCQVLPSCDN